MNQEYTVDPSRLVSPDMTPADTEEVSLRPKTLDDYIGQEKAKGNLKVYLRAAQQRGEPMDHILLYGPPGLGKTTLAGIVAQEMGVQIRITSGPAIEKPGDLAALLTNLQEGDILFIDEIHRLSRQVEEVLYPALEDFALDIMIGKGPSAQSIRINLPRFTLVGATTRAGQLTGPLRDRFGILLKLEPYSPRELGRIILRSAGILGVPSPRRARWSWPAVPAARRVSPTVCSSACATSPPYRETAQLTRRPPLPPASGWTLTSWVWTSWIAVSCAPSLRCTAAAPSVWKRWPQPWARRASPWRTSASRT